jgi:hypothetical protein
MLYLDIGGKVLSSLLYYILRMVEMHVEYSKIRHAYANKDRLMQYANAIQLAIRKYPIARTLATLYAHLKNASRGTNSDRIPKTIAFFRLEAYT